MSLAELAHGINQVLLETTIVSSAALVLVLLLRRRLRVVFGASVAYTAWLLVPVAAIAVLLPAAMSDTASIPLGVRTAVVQMQVVIAGTESGIDYMSWLAAAWLLGAVFTALHFMRQQRRFRTTLGHLQVRGYRLLQADSIAGLPAAIGLFKPLIVLPADFDTRYSAEQRDLMLAHEQSHVRHGDLQANGAYLMLRCVFWFNPLLHMAAGAFRHDQELACDQRVITRYPQSRRAYGEAMFRTQLAAQPLPLGCHWGLTHPLKERIKMLKQPVTKQAWRNGGLLLVLAMSLGTGFAAWSAQPAGPVDGTQGALQVTSHDAPKAVTQGPVIESSAQTPAAAMPEVIKYVRPVYPKTAEDQQITGKVWLAFEVAPDGSVIDVTVDKSQPADVFDAAALDAGRKWKFKASDKSQGKQMIRKAIVAVYFEAPKTLQPSSNQADHAAVLEVGKYTSPVYPKTTKDKNISGKVILNVDVAADGSVMDARVASSEPKDKFDATALKMVKTKTFTPRMMDGKAVESTVSVSITFE